MRTNGTTGPSTGGGRARSALRRGGRSRRGPGQAVALAVVVVALAAGCTPLRVPLWAGTGSGDDFASAYVTRDGDDALRVRAMGTEVRAEALPTNDDSNTRMVFWPQGVATATDAESCATWTGRAGQLVQQGAALRVTRSSSRVRAVTVTQNIMYGAGWVLNVHTWDTARSPVSQLVGRVDLGRGFLGRPARPLPWRLCARVIGDTVDVKVWDPRTRPEPAWGDRYHGGAVRLPGGWRQRGHAGWYIGHLRATDHARFASLATASYDPDAVPPPPPPPPPPTTTTGWLNDPTAEGRRVAVAGDSLIHRHLPAWRSGPLAAQGPLAVWLRDGASLDAPGSWVRTVSPHVEALVLAQVVNSAWPLFGGDGWQDQDRADLDHAILEARMAWRRADSFPGVRCIVLVTAGHPPDAPDLVQESFAAANAELRARAEADDSIRLADWAEVTTDGASYEADGLHLTDEGSDAYQQVIADAVASCPASRSD